MNDNQPNEFGTLISQKITSESDTFYHHYDALGSTAALTDSSEVVTDEYAFEAFGETAAESGATPNPYQWVAQVGYRKDEETSLYDLRRRNYDISTGRFSSEDPVQSDEENLYRYVGNRPADKTDPSGLQEFPKELDYLARRLSERENERRRHLQLMKENLAMGKFLLPLNLPNGKFVYLTNNKDIEPNYDVGVVRIDGPTNFREALQYAKLAYSLSVVDSKVRQLSSRVKSLREEESERDRKQINEIKLQLSHSFKPSFSVFGVPSWIPFVKGLSNEELVESAKNELMLENSQSISKSLKTKFKQKGYDQYLVSADTKGTANAVNVEEGTGAEKTIEAFGVYYSSNEAIHYTGDELILFDVFSVLRAGGKILLGKLAARRLAASEAKALADDVAELAGKNIDELLEKLGFQAEDLLSAAINRSSPHLKVLPSPKTLDRIERFAELKGIKYTFDPNVTSPFTNTKTGVVTFRGTPGKSTLADVPIIDIMDEFAHAWGLINPNLVGATSMRGAPYLRFHQEVFGRTSLLKTLTAQEAEALQWAEIQMINALEDLSKYGRR